MEYSQDFEYIKAKLEQLPEVTLPVSLTAESLWAKLDARETPAAQAAAPPKGKSVAFVRRWRPVLSYAAVFVVLVAVYYGAGLGGAPVPAPAAPAPDAPMSAAAANEGIAPRGVPQTGGGEESQMFSAPSPAQEEAALDSGGDAPLMMGAPTPQMAMDTGGEPQTLDYYQSLTAELRVLGAAPPPPALAKAESTHVWDMAVKDDKQVYMYEYLENSPNKISILSEKTRQPLGSFPVGGGRIVDLIPSSASLLVVEQVEPSPELYLGEGMTPVEEGAESSTSLPVCGAVQVTAYNVSDPAAVFATYSYIQEGRYFTHRQDAAGLTLVTQKSIELPEDGALLCNVAPMATAAHIADGTLHALEPLRYPQGEPREYLTLSRVAELGTDGWYTDTVAVLGSRLAVQLGDRIAFVLSGDAQVDGAKALESVTAGDLTIELR